jgi:hypothetical protein
MKYSKSDSEYFRNKKGGGLETNGKLNNRNFSRNERESYTNKFSIISNNKFDRKLTEINPHKNKTMTELSEMNSSGKYKIKPIKIMVKKNLLSANEHYIFFGLNRENGIYEYVMYVNRNLGQLNTTGSPIICKKREENGRIVELTHKQFLKINVNELSILFYHLLLISKKNKDFIDKKFFDYLYQFVLPIILNTNVHNNNYKYIVGEIKKMLHFPPNNNTNNPELPKRTRQ